jgi:RNA polymerase sigma factor (sigma-70 family)
MTTSVTASSAPRASEDAETERLYAEYSDCILAYCLRRLGSRAEAEDAVQMTFLYALRALRRGVVPNSESAWLHAIARNVCRGQHRTASRRPVSGPQGLELLPSPERDDERERLAGLREALESLPTRQRHALLLREWRGLSAQEIADYLSLSPPATHALLTRARRSLALALTAPGRAALGLASLVYELRAWIKTALGGASAKAAVATVAVVAVGAGTVAADRSVGKERDARAPGTSAVDTVTGDPSLARSSSRATAPVRGSVVVERQGRDGAAPDASQRATATLRGAWTSPQRGFAPALPEGGGDRTAGPEAPSETPVPPAPERPGAPTGDLPPLPGTELPSDLLPPLDPPATPPLPEVDLPPVDVPPIDVPAVDVPPVDLPTDLVPPVDLPSVDPSPVDVPPLDIPPLDLPPLPRLP